MNAIKARIKQVILPTKIKQNAVLAFCAKPHNDFHGTQTITFIGSFLQKYKITLYGFTVIKMSILALYILSFDPKVHFLPLDKNI